MTDDQDLNQNDIQKEPEASQSADALQACEQKRDEYLNGWKRAQADFINYKKDEARRFSEAVAFSNKELIREILPSLDSFDLALSSAEKDSAVYKGILMIKSQLLDALKHHGVERIKVVPGEEFDSNLHEALAEVEWKPDSQTQDVSGKIVEELVAGYTLNGRVIRAAKVNIAR